MLRAQPVLCLSRCKYRMPQTHSATSILGSMPEERIMTLHPGGKQGVRIVKSKYDQVRNFILDKVKAHGDLSFDELTDMATEELAPVFDGKVIWYMVTVKLDLEARALIERIPKTSPHRLHIKADH